VESDRREEGYESPGLVTPIKCPTFQTLPFPSVLDSTTPSLPQLKYNYTEPRRNYVQLYAFAQRSNVDSLNALVLLKIWRIIVENRDKGGLIGGIINLVIYTYQNTPKTQDEPLRDMRTQYTASEFELLMSQETFRTYRAEGRQFVRDTSVKLGRSL